MYEGQANLILILFHRPNITFSSVSETVEQIRNDVKEELLKTAYKIL
jgi:FAD synthase